MGNTAVAPIGVRLKNIRDGNFLGLTHEGKTQFRILPSGCTLPPQREETICSSFSLSVLVAGYLYFYVIVLGK